MTQKSAAGNGPAPKTTAPNPKAVASGGQKTKAPKPNESAMDKAAVHNREVQRNGNHLTYWKDRGLDRRPEKLGSAA
jgi:hypothetical protein